MSKNDSGFMADLADQIALKLSKKLNLAPDDAANIGNEVAEELRGLWSGQSIYIPKTDKKALAAKYSDIVEANKKEGITPRLCHKFGLTKQRLRQIVASEMRKEREKVP